MRTEPPSDFEAAVLSHIAAASADAALRMQLAQVAITDRDWTVVGCYSTLTVPKRAPETLEPYGSRGPVDGPHFESSTLKHGGGTLLWFKDGRADCLEIYTYDDTFPQDHADLVDFRLFAGA